MYKSDITRIFVAYVWYARVSDFCIISYLSLQVYST